MEIVKKTLSWIEFDLYLTSSSLYLKLIERDRDREMHVLFFLSLPRTFECSLRVTYQDTIARNL